MKNVGISVQARLKNLSKATGMDMPSLYRRYVQERLMYRLAISPEADNFALKGGLLMAAYNGGDLLRPTEDIDFNGNDGDGTVDRLRDTLVRILETECEDDGVVFDISSMVIAKDRTGIVPGGKISMYAKVGTAKVDLKVDVGFGNPVTPTTRLMQFPTLLEGMQPPVMNAYPLETVVAEKLHAMVQFGIRNTRVKDHYDILMLSRQHAFDGDVLSDAIATTFAHQQREIPEAVSGLSAEYVQEASQIWRKFLSKLPGKPGMEFGVIMEEIKDFLIPPLEDAKQGIRPGKQWEPDTGWSGPSPKPS